MLKAGWLLFPLRPPPLLLFHHKQVLSRKNGFLSLMANSHKFVLNMSFIDWPCRMNTIKETAAALSASHLGGEDGGIKRGETEGGKQRKGWMD